MFLNRDTNPNEEDEVAESPRWSVRAYNSVILYMGNFTFKNCEDFNY